MRRRSYRVRFRFSVPDDEDRGRLLHQAMVILLEAFGRLRRLGAEPKMALEDESLPPDG